VTESSLPVNARYVVYQFNCPKSHVNDREVIVLGATTADAALKAVLGQELTCSECGTKLPGQTAVSVSENRDMPSISADWE
jgi:hypothetical protein